MLTVGGVDIAVAEFREVTPAIQGHEATAIHGEFTHKIRSIKRRFRVITDLLDSSEYSTQYGAVTTRGSQTLGGAMMPSGVTAGFTEPEGGEFVRDGTSFKQTIEFVIREA